MLTGGMLDPSAELAQILDGLDRDIREPTRLRAVLVPELKRVLEAGHGRRKRTSCATATVWSARRACRA